MAAAVFVSFVSDYESDLWFAPFGIVLEPVGLVAGTGLVLAAPFRALQAFGALGVVYVRPFDDGSALVGSWWRVRRGHGLQVDQDSKIRLKVIAGDQKLFGWTRKSGIPAYMVWSISRKEVTLSWLTPFAAAPDATQRIHAALAQLPDPTFETLHTSQATQATPLTLFPRLR